MPGRLAHRPHFTHSSRIVESSVMVLILHQGAQIHNHQEELFECRSLSLSSIVSIRSSLRSRWTS